MMLVVFLVFFLTCTIDKMKIVSKVRFQRIEPRIIGAKMKYQEKGTRISICNQKPVRFIEARQPKPSSSEKFIVQIADVIGRITTYLHEDMTLCTKRLLHQKDESSLSKFKFAKMTFYT